MNLGATLASIYGLGKVFDCPWSELEWVASSPIVLGEVFELRESSVPYVPLSPLLRHLGERGEMRLCCNPSFDWVSIQCLYAEFVTVEFSVTVSNADQAHSVVLLLSPKASHYGKIGDELMAIRSSKFWT